MYGAKFLDMWASVDKGMLKQAWSEELAGFTADELKRGIAECKTRNFPPTLPEFIGLCRAKAKITAESAFFEAVEQIVKRERGDDTWSHPAVYWTAAKIGAFDLRNNPWQTIKSRWTAEFDKQMANSSWPAIPGHMQSLPAPGQQSISRDEAKKRAAELGINVKTEADKKNPKAWAERIFEQYAQGLYDLDIGLKLAEEALGRNRPERLKRAA